MTRETVSIAIIFVLAMTLLVFGIVNAYAQGPCPDGSYPPPCGSCPGQEPPTNLPPPPRPPEHELEEGCFHIPSLFEPALAYASLTEEEPQIAPQVIPPPTF